MEITFHGAVRTVTGSQHLVAVNGLKILLDCGLYQGSRKESYTRNQNLPFDAAEVDIREIVVGATLLRRDPDLGGRGLVVELDPQALQQFLGPVAVQAPRLQVTPVQLHPQTGDLAGLPGADLGPVDAGHRHHLGGGGGKQHALEACRTRFRRGPGNGAR